MQCDEIHDKMMAYISSLKTAQASILDTGTAVKLKQQKSGKQLTTSKLRKERVLEPAPRKYNTPHTLTKQYTLSG